MKDDIKVILGVFGMILLAVLLVAVMQACSSKVGKKYFEKQIEGYSTIVVNGEEFPIKDIVEINCISQPYTEDTIEIIFTNGTKVTFSENAYTLKK